MVLLHYLRWRREQGAVNDLLLERGGALHAQFAQLGRVTVFDSLPVHAPRNIAQRVMRKTGLFYREDYCFNPLREIYPRGSVDLIYSNTLANENVLERLAYLDCPVVTHVHELPYMIDHGIGAECGRRILQSSIHTIAASRAVQSSLISRYGVEPRRVDCVHEFVPARQIAGQAMDAAGVRARLGISPSSWVVCASGTPTWRKGLDLFVPLVRALDGAAHGRELHALWIGGGQRSTVGHEFEYDVARLHLKARIHFISVQRDPLPYYAASDIFVLPSREDPYPLVMLEAAALGKPIVCFNAAGGAPEFVENDAGHVVDYLDVDAMAARVLDLLVSDEKRARMGLRAREKVCERHDVTVGAPQVEAILRRIDRAR